MRLRRMVFDVPLVAGTAVMLALFLVRFGL